MATVTRAQLLSDFDLYSEKLLWIVNKDSQWQRLHLKACQRRVLDAITRCISRGMPPRIVILKARQMGFSTLVQGLLFRGVHLIPNYSALVIAHKKDSTKALFDKSRQFYARLPNSIRPAKRFSGKLELELMTGSRIAVEVASKDGGRGITAMGVHLSEFAYYPDPMAVLQAVLGSVPKTVNSLVIVESTPNGFNEFRDLYVAAKSGESDFEAVFVPWFEEPTYRMDVPLPGDNLDERERELRDKHACDLHQLAWRRYVIRTELKGDAERFEVEYPSDDIRCFTLTGSPVFESDALQYYNSMVPPAVLADTLPPRMSVELDVVEKKAMLTETREGELSIYCAGGVPDPRRLYIVSADPSEGDKGSDPSPIVVVDRHTLEPCAVWDGRARPDRLARIGCALAMYFNNAIHTWESNSHGLAYQIEAEKHYDNFYFRPTSLDSVAKVIGEKPGWDNKSKTRDFAIDTLIRLVNGQMCPIRHPRMVAELSTLYYQQTPGGKRKADHQSGKTSDLLMAYAIALVAHRHDDDSTELAPLSQEDIATLLSELYRIQQLESMGITGGRKVLVDRFNITAAELEEYDEAQAARTRRSQSLGIGRQV